MSELLKVRRNSVYSFFSIFFRLFSNVILFWLIARFYGKEIFGQFTLAQTFASIFIVFADFGFDMLLATEVPKNKNNSAAIFNSFFPLKLFFTTLAFCGMIIIISFNNYSSDVKILIFIFTFYAIFTTIMNFFFGFLKGHEKLQYEAKVSFIINFGTLAILLFFVINKTNIVIISIIFASTRFLGLLLSTYYALKVQPFIRFKLNFSNYSKVLNQVLIFGSFLIFGNLYFQIDTILISYFKGEGAVGIYQAVFRIILLPLILPEVMINSILPVLSRNYISNNKEWSTLGQTLNKFLIVFGIPIFLATYFFAEEIIHLIYSGKDFAMSIPILRIFSFIILIRFYSETFGLMLTTSGKQKNRMHIVLVATIINAILNIVLIPEFGVIGAAYISLFTNIFVMVSFILQSHELFLKWRTNLLNANLIIGTLTIAVFFYFLSFSPYWYLSFMIVLGFLVFSYYKILDPLEREFFSIFNKIKFISN